MKKYVIVKGPVYHCSNEKGSLEFQINELAEAGYVAKGQLIMHPSGGDLGYCLMELADVTGKP